MKWGGRPRLLPLFFAQSPGRCMRHAPASRISFPGSRALDKPCGSWRDSQSEACEAGEFVPHTARTKLRRPRATCCGCPPGHGTASITYRRACLLARAPIVCYWHSTGALELCLSPCRELQLSAPASFICASNRSLRLTLSTPCCLHPTSSKS